VYRPLEFDVYMNMRIVPRRRRTSIIDVSRRMTYTDVVGTMCVVLLLGVVSVFSSSTRRGRNAAR
jgi:hypothetical protein